MITYLIQVTLCLGVFYGFYHFVLQRDTLFQFNRAYLLVTLLFSLFLPLLRIYVDSPSGKSEAMMLPYHYVGYYVDAFSTGIEIKPEAKSFPWGKVLAVLYGFGVMAMAFRFVKSLREIIRIRNTGTLMAISGHPCIFSEKVKSPFSFFNAVYLPHDHSFTPIELQEILAHENVHIQGRHTWDILLLELACIFLWPSPLIYLYRKSLKEVHEYMADAEVIRHTPWEQYAKLLLSQHQSHLLNQLTHQFFYSQLKKRLRMMNQKQSGSFAGLKYLGLIPLALLALVFFSLRAQSGLSESPAMMLETDPSRNPIQLYIDADHTYFLNGREVPLAKLEEILREVVSEIQNPTIHLKMEKSLTVQELAAVLTIGEKLHIRMVLDSGEEIKQPASSLHGGLNSYGDTLPDTYIRAYKTEKPKQEQDEIESGVPTSEEWKRLGDERALPIFPGCEAVPLADQGMCGMTKLGEYIHSNMLYPTSMKQAEIEGKVVVRFIVGADGYIKDTKIAESLHPDADKTVLDLIAGMNSKAGKWLPARKEGKSYDAEMTLPVKFALDQTAPQWEPLRIVDEMARFPGCEHIVDAEERSACAQNKMMQFIYENLKYPGEDRDQNVEGTGMVQFIVEADGRLSGIEVRRAPSPSIKAELIRIMNLMAALPDRWIPAQKDGHPVSFQLTLPVRFVLQEKTQEEKNKD